MTSISTCKLILVLSCALSIFHLRGALSLDLFPARLKWWTQHIHSCQLQTSSLAFLSWFPYSTWDHDLGIQASTSLPSCPSLRLFQLRSTQLSGRMMQRIEHQFGAISVSIQLTLVFYRKLKVWMKLRTYRYLWIRELRHARLLSREGSIKLQDYRVLWSVDDRKVALSLTCVYLNPSTLQRRMELLLELAICVGTPIVVTGLCEYFNKPSTHFWLGIKTILCKAPVIKFMKNWDVLS